MLRYSGRVARIHRRKALLGLGTSFAMLGRTARAEDRVVETATGKVRGSQQAGVQVFRGIRYGESTEGRRFMAPAAVKPWPGTVEAKTAGNSAPQIPGATYPIALWYTKIELISEDCLFLNVF